MMHQVYIASCRGNNMKVCSLASSSKGNCTIVYNDREILLVDMGITLKDLESKMDRLKLNMSHIVGVVISHEHTDHTKGILALVRKYAVPVYCHYDAVDGIINKTKISSLCITRFSDAEFKIGSFLINSFKVCHDVCCVGYNIYENGNKISIVTDLGHTTKEIVEKLYNSRLVILEANHDEKMVVASTKYPAVLKSRILGNKGHLSNVSSAKVVSQLAQQHGCWCDNRLFKEPDHYRGWFPRRGSGKSPGYEPGLFNRLYCSDS